LSIIFDTTAGVAGQNDLRDDVKAAIKS